jgi:acyl-coenzyme A thioesterase PaaI-like protein
MASPLSAVASLTAAASSVAAAASAILNGGNVADTVDIFPVQNLGTPTRLPLAGIPNLEPTYHLPFEQGRFMESPIGDAMSDLTKKNLDLVEKIQTYLNMNKLATDGQLPTAARAPKFVADSVAFVQQIRTFNTQSLNIATALNANVAALSAAELRMLNMINANANALANLLHQICNWGLPNLPSLAATLGNIFHFNGFNFNSAAGFNFQQLISGFSSAAISSLSAFTNFSFSQCSLNTPNIASAFAPVTSISDSGLTITAAPLPPPIAGGTFSTPAAPATAEQLASTTVPVFNPALVTSNNGTSLPTPASIVSNFALPPATYAANIVSAVPVLSSAIVQPGGVANPTLLRSLAISNINLTTIVAEQFNPNLVACWLFYLNLNRIGRGGNWLPNFQAAYTEFITPSLNYLATTPIPWNSVSAAPAAIPLIPLINTIPNEPAENIMWKLSFIEASLLGYARTTTWDAGADDVFLSTFTGFDLDYVPTIIAATPTQSTILGETTAEFPVQATYPQSIAGTLADVITEATLNIANTPTFQTTSPQFLFTFNLFAVASLVDRFTQFWRQFNAELNTFLAMEDFLVQFVVTYPAALDAAIDPLGNPADFNQIQADASTRSQTWTPGSVSLPIPTATVLSSSPTAPTALTTGWTTGTFDAAAYLTRPDIQAQPIPVQVAMLRTNQSFATLMTLSGNLQMAVASAVSSATIAANSIGMPGWEVETSAEFMVVPGAAGSVVSFATIDFDQTGFVESPTTIDIQSTNPYAVAVMLNWDTTGASGTRNVLLTQNGTVVAMASGGPGSTTPFVTSISTLLDLNQGDILQVIATHSLSTPQGVLSGSSFLGLLDTNAAASATTATPTTPGTPAPATASNTVNFTSGAIFPAFIAVAQSSMGGDILPVDPTTTVVGKIPFVDGIAMSASTESGEMIPVAVQYGGVYSAPGMTWTPGGLLFVDADGVLTQDFADLIVNVRWIVAIGKAITTNTFMFAPHIPTNFVQNF